MTWVQSVSVSVRHISRVGHIRARHTVSHIGELYRMSHTWMIVATPSCWNGSSAACSPEQSPSQERWIGHNTGSQAPIGTRRRTGTHRHLAAHIPPRGWGAELRTA